MANVQFQQTVKTLFTAKSLKRLAASTLLLLSASALADNAKSFDGLVLKVKENNRVVYLHPDANINNYQNYQLLGADIRFRKNWQRDHNRKATTLSQRLSSQDVMRMKSEVAELFNDVFTDEFTKRNLPLVKQADENTLIIRPAIIDLDVYSPEVDKASRQKNYTKSTGEATIYIELYDAVSGDILARAYERKAIGDRNHYIRANRVTNRADAKAAIKRWAERLIETFEAAKAN